MDFNIIAQVGEFVGFRENTRANDPEVLWHDIKKNNISVYSFLNTFDDEKALLSSEISLNNIESQNAKLYNFISDILIEDKNYHVVIYSKKDLFVFYLIDENGKVYLTETFLGPPMLLYNPLKSQYVFVGTQQNEKKISFLYYKSDEKKLDEIYSIDDYILVKEHSSTVLDLSGNLMPDLVLDCKCIKDDSKYVKIYSFEFDNDTLNLSLKWDTDIPDSTHCVLFFPSVYDHLKYDFIVFYHNNSKGLCAIYYENRLSEFFDESKPFKKLYNTKEKALRQLDVNKKKIEFEKKKDILIHNDILPKKIIIDDVSANGTYRIFILDEKGQSLHVYNITDDNISKTDDLNNNFKMLKNKRILKIGIAQLKTSSSKQLFFEYLEDSMTFLGYLTIDKPDLNNYNSIILLEGKSLYKSNLIPGATVLVGISNGKHIKRISQMPNTYSNLQTFRFSFFGVGSTHFFLSYVVYYHPIKKQYYALNTYVFPSTSTMILFNDNIYPIVYMHFQSPYLTANIIILASMSFIFIIILLYLSRKEKMSAVRDAKEDDLNVLIKTL